MKVIHKIIFLLFLPFLDHLNFVRAGKRVKRIVGGHQALAPPIDDPVVFVKLALKFARVEGTRNTKTGLYSFRGIRYAEPPIGPYRFQRPRYLRPEGDINATFNGPPCPQPDYYNPNRYIGHEDCLVLNIFTPKMPDETTGLPVVFFIHPGGYRYGSIAQYGAEPLTQKGVIFVPVQYRLGTLGIIGDGSKDFSGNLAMFDLTAALRWVTEYISFFGGDPKQIKVMGHGSGAASATYLTASNFPQGRSSISGVVAMSGSSMSEYMADTEPVQSTKDIALIHGCPTNNETVILKCLREKNVEEIVEKDSEVQTERLAGRNMVKGMTGGTGFNPHVEAVDDYRGLPGFITKEPDEAFTRGDFERVPILTGVTKDETANAIDLEQVQKVFTDGEKFLNDLKESVQIGNLLNLTNILGSLGNVQGLAPNIVKLDDYLKIPQSLDVQQIVGRLVNATTDALFNIPTFLTAKIWGKYAPSFVYSFEHVGEVASGTKLLAGLPIVGAKERKQDVVAHGDELAYLFDTFDLMGNPLPDNVKNSKDKKAQDAFTSLIAKFAYFKPNQTRSDPILQQFTSKGSPYIRIGEGLTVENDFRFCQLKMWGAPIEAIKTTSCTFLNEGLSKITGLVGGVAGQLPIAPLGEGLGISKPKTKPKQSLLGLGIL